MIQNALSIAELGDLIKSTLENELSPTYWVIGEIADFRQAPQGHAYFELVEKQGSQVLAKVRSNCWQFTYRSIASRFESVTGAGIKNGMKVLAQVQITFHSVYGLSLNIKDIDASFSLGERARIRQETIDRLTREGLIRRNASQHYPPVIQKIAIISSPTAAGYGDFLNHLDHNPNGFKIYHKLFPSLMQGNGAAQNLIQALDLVEAQIMDLGLEAVVIIRGGGAQLDLDCFDDYHLAEKIAKMTIPVFTGIGHERDETVADLVAHTRLKTPTAVADFLLGGFRIFEENLVFTLTRLDRLTRNTIQLVDSQLAQSNHRIKAAVQNRLNLEKERINSKSSRIQLAFQGMVHSALSQTETRGKELRKASELFLRQEKRNLESLEKSLFQLDPHALLKRGFTRTEIEGKPIHLAKPKIGDSIQTFTSSQKISSIVTEIENKKS